jgi:hypothetical protein
LPSVSTTSNATSNTNSNMPSSADSDIFATIEKLANLKTKGFISDAEFESKKSELLSRL